MIQSFFSKDNATAKLSTSLVLVASILSFVAQSLGLSPQINVILLISAGVATVAAQFFQRNKVLQTSAWITLAYLIADYIATNALAFAGAKEIAITLAGVLKLLAGFTTQIPGDAKPPVSEASGS